MSLSFPPAEVDIDTIPEDAQLEVLAEVEKPRRPGISMGLELVLLLVAGIFLALHFVHLRADFPNHSPWMDWAKYTDEGWYGDAAIRHYQLGHWNVAGDFNPAAALPVWPALELVLFRFTGVSLTAARAMTVVVFGLTLVCCYVLVRRWSGGRARRTLAPAVAVLLLAVNPFSFAFSRLAVLEPLLILLTLAALLTASMAGAAGERALGAWTRPFVVWSVALGLLLPLMVLTKTTGMFLFPAVFWMLWAACGYRMSLFARSAAMAGAVGAAGWGGYFLLFVRPRYLSDFRYLFSANGYTGITRATFGAVIYDTIFDGTWIGQTLFWVALAAAGGSIASLCVLRRRSNPLVAALLLWVFGYGAFLAYHANLQPRYYLMLAVPLTMLTAIAFDAVLARAMPARGGAMQWLARLGAGAGGAALLFAAAHGASITIGFVRHPEYTWVRAAEQIREVVDREARATGHSRMVLSISGSDLALITGLPAICDDFGTMTLPDRVAAYRPGWFATWNDVEDDKMEALAPVYRLVRVASIPAFDDPDRNLLILYRLDPLNQRGPAGKPGRRRTMIVPQRLRTRIGEQPSVTQLEH